MRISLRQQTALMLAFVCMLPANIFAGPADSTTHSDAKPVLRNVELARGGQIHGRVVDVHGRPVGGTFVQIATNDGVRDAKTNDKGQFVLAGLKGGPCVVKVAQASYGARLWKQGTAPPKSLKSFSIVNDPNFVVRGQDDVPDVYLEPAGLSGAQIIGVGVLAAGVIATIVIAAQDDDGAPPASP